LVVIEQAVQKDSISNASGDPKDITNKVDAANPTCTKGRKRRLSEDKIEQAVQKDSISNASGDPKDITNKVDAGNPTCTKGHKRRLLEDENLSIMTCKKSKVSVHARLFTYEINVFKRRKRTFA
jgi:hypothetical protein